MRFHGLGLHLKYFGFSGAGPGNYSGTFVDVATARLDVPRLRAIYPRACWVVVPFDRTAIWGGAGTGSFTAQWPKLKAQVESLIASGFCVILDFHPDDGGVTASTDKGRLQGNLLLNGVPFRNIYVAMWSAIASEFAGQHTDRLAYRDLNEPAIQPEQLLITRNLFRNAVRSVEPGRYLVYHANTYDGALADSDVNWVPDWDREFASGMSGMSAHLYGSERLADGTKSPGIHLLAFSGQSWAPGLANLVGDFSPSYPLVEGDLVALSSDLLTRGGAGDAAASAIVNGALSLGWNTLRASREAERLATFRRKYRCQVVVTEHLGYQSFELGLATSAAMCKDVTESLLRHDIPYAPFCAATNTGIGNIGYLSTGSGTDLAVKPPFDVVVGSRPVRSPGATTLPDPPSIPGVVVWHSGHQALVEHGEWFRLSDWADLVGHNPAFLHDPIPARRPVVVRTDTGGAVMFDAVRRTVFEGGVDLSRLVEGAVCILCRAVYRTPYDETSSGAPVSGLGTAQGSHYTWFQDGLVYMGIGSTTRLSFSPTYEMREWHVLTIRSEPDTYQVRVNGAVVANRDSNSPSFVNGYFIGMTSGATRRYWSGLISDIVMLDTADLSIVNQVEAWMMARARI